MDQKTRKLMTKHKALHPRDDVDKLYVSRKEGGGRPINTEYSASISIQRFKDNIQMCGGRLISANRYNTNNTMINKTEIARKQKWEEK